MRIICSWCGSAVYPVLLVPTATSRDVEIRRVPGADDDEHVAWTIEEWIDLRFRCPKGHDQDVVPPHVERAKTPD